MSSKEYSRIYHYPFSPRTTNDDRINHTYWEDVREINTLIHTERLDGENNCPNRYGILVRSYAVPTILPWASQLRQRRELLKNDLGNTEPLGKNLYVVHSIEYKQLETYFYMFAAHCLDEWLSWEEVKFHAALRDLPTAPELCTGQVDGLIAETLKQHVICLAREPSALGSRDVLTGMDCIREGVITRNAGEHLTADFVRNVFRYVRQGHVQTDEHWTRHQKRICPMWESKQGRGGNE